MRELKTKNVYFVEIPIITEANRGSLCFGEIKKHIPFDIKRFYCILDSPPGQSRGNHAHYQGEQVLFCLRGSIKIKLDDGFAKDEIVLDKPNIGIFIGKMVWNKLTNFQKETVLLILRADFHNEKDYIRDYKKFKTLVAKQ